MILLYFSHHCRIIMIIVDLFIENCRKDTHNYKFIHVVLWF